MSPSPHLDMTDPSEGAAGQAAVIADNQHRVDAMTLLTVLDRDLTSAPSLTSPGDDGKRYIVGAAHATWTGTRNGTPATAFVAGDIALFYGSGFIAWAPEDGWEAHVVDEACSLYWDAAFGGWVDAARRVVFTPVGASTTQTQGAATQMRYGMNRITTCANANDAVKLPAARAGAECIVFNRGAQTAQVFPASGDKIEGGAADASTTLAASKNAWFGSVDGTDWYKITGA